MNSHIHVVTLKAGMPTVEQARSRLKAEIDRAKNRGMTALKLIHGYGSSGVGGHLRGAIRNSLRKRRKEGTIRGFVPGEKWDIFEESTQMILLECPQLQHDPDLNNANEGVTIVLL